MGALPVIIILILPPKPSLTLENTKLSNSMLSYSPESWSYDIFEFKPFEIRQPANPVDDYPNFFWIVSAILLYNLGTATKLVGLIKATSSLNFVISPQ